MDLTQNIPPNNHSKASTSEMGSTKKKNQPSVISISLKIQTHDAQDLDGSRFLSNKKKIKIKKLFDNGNSKN